MRDGNNNDNSGNGARKKKTLEEIHNEILNYYRLRYSSQDDRIIADGKSGSDVFQEKWIEFWKRNQKPGADPEKDAEYFFYRVYQGIGKLYKNAQIFGTLDDVNPKYLAEKARIEERTEKLEIIKRIINKCSLRDQLVIALRWHWGFEYKEVAARADISEENARKIVYDFNQKCREFGIDSPDE